MSFKFFITSFMEKISLNTEKVYDIQMLFITHQFKNILTKQDFFQNQLNKQVI